MGSGSSLNHNLYAMGTSEIAAKLGVSEKTVRNDIKSGLRKLRARGAELLLYRERRSNNVGTMVDLMDQIVEGERDGTWTGIHQLAAKNRKATA